jgi:hypothetical protein
MCRRSQKTERRLLRLILSAPLAQCLRLALWGRKPLSVQLARQPQLDLWGLWDQRYPSAQSDQYHQSVPLARSIRSAQLVPWDHKLW